MARDRSLDIAVSGMAGRFPGSSDLAEWWASLTTGRVLTRRYTRAELAAAGVPAELLDDPDYVPVHGHLADADRFDNTVFRMSPREAEMLDPQHRLMLECAWSALEDAGVNPMNTGLTTAVYASASGSGYLRRMIAGGGLDPLTLEDALHGNESDFLASHISYKLHLTGPALAVQTACSSSLVAVHLAVQSLLNGECDQAVVVAAGMAYPQAGHLRVAGGIHSAAGHCRPFDKSADGVVAGSGVACVVLRRLADAVDDGPEPYGVILGSAVNNDGSGKVGYYAPSVSGQEAVIRAAIRAADVDGASIGYLETHGTGTLVGDPIEWSAAAAALRASGASAGQVAVGALKANTGHLDNAAGLAGLMKALLVVREAVVPPVAGHTELNPLLEDDDSPLYVPVEAGAWSGPEPRRAGVSSFGVGGTNAHVLVEAPPQRAGAPGTAAPDAAAHLVLLSAADPGALDRSADRLGGHLRVHRPRPVDVARTLAIGRAALTERLAVVGGSVDEIAERLSSPAEVIRGSVPVDGPAPLVLAFPGQGAQYPGMAGPLTGSLPGFTASLANCVALFDADTADRVDRALHDPAFPEEELAQTALAQPALFALEYATATALGELGLRPAAVVGHSLGEITAACLAGVLSLPDAARFVLARGRAMQQCPPGAMLALACGEDEARELLTASGLGLETAAVNSPEATVLAGTTADVEAFGAWLDGRVHSRRLRTGRAFHSALVEAALPPLREELSRISLHPPVIPWATNSGRIVPPGAAVDPELFVAQARHTVRFGPALQQLHALLPTAVLVETGPGRVLSAMAESAGFTAVPLGAGRATEAREAVPTALGTLWTMGQPLATAAICRDGEPVRLPGYPFAGPRRTAPEALMPTAARRPAPESPPESPDPTAAAPPADEQDVDVPALVSRVWQELLGHEQLTDDADFFDQGGDSLIVTHLARRLRTGLGVRVPIRDLMVSRTLGAQTALCQDLVHAR
ncbi:type I polyketide synthase [Micromonosporaceae bacterium Da 78-11]